MPPDRRNTHDHPHETTNVHPAGTPVAELLEAQPQRHTNTSTLTPVTILPKFQATHSIPACTFRSALWVTHLSALGCLARWRARCPCPPPNTGTRRYVGAVETGRFFGVTANGFESLPPFRSLAKQFLMTSSARLTLPPMPSPGRGSFS